jgi:hypothetical protein
VVRTNYWDRATGRYRLEGKGDEGAYRVYLNVDTGTGEAWLGGKKLTDAEKIAQWLDMARDAAARDTTWLVGPFRMFDPDSALRYVDVASVSSAGRCDLLSMTVRWSMSDRRRVRDKYFLCVDQKSHLVAASYTNWWAALSAWHRDGWIWSDWQKRGPILVSTVREHLSEEGRRVRFDKITISDKPDDAALTPPK